MYIHGKGGSAKEAEHYKPMFPNCDVVGLDYKSNTPWDAKDEFSKIFDRLTKNYKHIVLIANSIGAYFSMFSLADKKFDKTLFISPIVNMKKLIHHMMSQAKVS